MHRVGATDRLDARFRKPEMLHLALLDQFLDRTGDVFDWHVRVDAVLIEQIDHISLEAFERGLGDLLDMLRPAVQARRPRPRVTATKVEPEFGGNDHALAKWGKSFTDEFFVNIRAINFSGIEEGHTALHG